ncbi:bile acid:sodium symporter family protein [Hydrogenophaga sp. UC242_50]
MPLNFAFWGGIHPTAAPLLKTIALDPLEMFGHILLIIGVPFVLGIWCAHRFPNWTARFKKPVRILSFLALIAFIVGAIAGNWRYFLDYVGLVLLAVVIHDALAFGTGYAIARAAGLPDYDRRAVSIEVGIRNAGLGLVIIFSFFGGLGGMAVVAGVWGFWDIIAGLILAGWWARRPLQGGVPGIEKP